MSTSAKHVPYLDGWRGLAIALLLAGHFFPVRGINLGGLGVNFFFVLSGLLMGRILFIERIPISTFYQRRIARIFPLAYFFIAAILVWYLLNGLPVHSTQLLATTLFLSNYVSDNTHVVPMPIGHFWSLCVEEHAYVLLSLVALCSRGRRFAARPAIGFLMLSAVLIGIFYSLTYQGPDLYHELWLHSEVSGFGILVSVFFLMYFQDKTLRPVPAILIIFLICLGMGLHWWRFSAAIRTFVGVTALAIAINLLDRAPAWIHKVLSFKPLSYLGQLSFSIYIWQQPFYIAVEMQQVSPLTGVACALVTGALSFYLIERPARTGLNRLWPKKSPPQNTLSGRELANGS